VFCSSEHVLQRHNLKSSQQVQTKKAAGEPAAVKLPQLGLNQRHFNYRLPTIGVFSLMIH
jgi:hypothetical protein